MFNCVCKVDGLRVNIEYNVMYLFRTLWVWKDVYYCFLVWKKQFIEDNVDYEFVLVMLCVYIYLNINQG